MQEYFINQLSVFIENTEGRAFKITDVLDRAGINIRGFMISDTMDYGIVRIVVDKPDEAFDVLKSEGFTVKETQILVVQLGDTPGDLAHLFKLFCETHINIVYSYSLISTYVAIKTLDLNQAAKMLIEAGQDLVTQELLSASHFTCMAEEDF